MTDLAEVNENTRRAMRRADAAAGFVVALVVAIALALLLVHWLTPCEPGHLCAMGAVMTRTPLHRRIWCALRAAYLRWLLRSVERDIEWHRAQAELSPLLADLAERRAGELRVQLIDVQ